MLEPNLNWRRRRWRRRRNRRRELSIMIEDDVYAISSSSIDRKRRQWEVPSFISCSLVVAW